jgi:hypothetical protein
MLAAGPAGPRTVKVSYLAHGFAWSSDYVAQLDERSDTLALSGWATLTNSTGAVFEQADVQLVAGRLNILAAEEGGSAAEPVYAGEGESAVDARARVIEEQAESEVSLLRECFATAPPILFQQRGLPAPMPMFDRRGAFSAPQELMVTAARIEREELGDYQLYRLPWKTDLNARQTKQVLFLDEPEVDVERIYGFRVESLTTPLAVDVVIPNLVVRFENTEADGLGEPLPRGVVRVFESHGGSPVFAGEAEMEDRPVGLPVELTIGRAQNVLLEVRMSTRSAPRRGRRGVVVETEHRIVNNKGLPIDLEIRHAVEDSGLDYTDARVERSSRPMRRKYGDFAWRFAVQPGEDLLQYRLSALEQEPR